MTEETSRVKVTTKSDQLSANISIKLSLGPAWESAANTHPIKLQRLQNMVLPTSGKFPRNTPIPDMHTTFQIPYVCDYITKLCRHKHK
jgi:hypothetical protein